MPPYLVGPDERLHCQVVLHQFVHVGLGGHQGLCSGHGRQGTWAQGERALVGGAWGCPSIGVSEKNVPGLKREGTRVTARGPGPHFQPEENCSWQAGHVGSLLLPPKGGSPGGRASLLHPSGCPRARTQMLSGCPSITTPKAEAGQAPTCLFVP